MPGQGPFGDAAFGGDVISLSVIDLCNDSLSQIGQPPIQGLDDNSVNANYCANFYISLRNSELRNHLWNFALTRAELLRSSQAPIYQYQYSYLLPVDCLRVLRVGMDDSRLWKVEGARIVTNMSNVSQPLFLQYIAIVEDPLEWDSIFYQAMAKKMAAKLCTAILKNFKLAAELEAQYKALFYDAAAVDSQEGIQEKMDVPDLTENVRNDW